VPNFVSFTASIADLAHGENRVINQSVTHSVTQSLTQLIWCTKNWSFRFGISFQFSNFVILTKFHGFALIWKSQWQQFRLQTQEHHCSHTHMCSIDKRRKLQDGNS